MQSIKMYGIKNCDTVRKSLRWFTDHNVKIDFVDFKKSPPDCSDIARWVEAFGWDKLINKRGTTWRKLPDTSKNNNEPSFLAQLLIEQPSIIKRPIVEIVGRCYLGYQPDVWQEALK